MARGKARVPCELCDVSVSTRQTLSQHVRNQHGTTLTELKKASRSTPVKRNPIKRTPLPSVDESVRIEDALLVRARGRTWIALPVESLFSG